MKFTKPSITNARRLLAMGLLSTTLPTVINDFIHIPDFFRGVMLGIGLGMEVIGVMLLRGRNSPGGENNGGGVETQ